MNEKLSRRAALLALATSLSAVCLPLHAQSGKYFESTRWFAWQPGRLTPKEYVGYLMVSESSQVMRFYFDHSSLLELNFRDIGSFTYEFAARPQNVEMPPKGWSRMKKKTAKHLLTVVYREARKASPPPSSAGGAAEGNFAVRKTVFELSPANYGEVLETLELATGLAV